MKKTEAKDKSPIVTTPPTRFNFVEEAQKNYGVKMIGDRVYEVEVGGMKFSGTLSYVMGVVNNEQPGIWGNP